MDAIHSLIQILAGHPITTTAIITWIFNNVITALITNLPAPTQGSSAMYVYWFKVLNTVIGNVSRAKSTAIEHSPNWQDAVAKVHNGSPGA